MSITKINLKVKIYFFNLPKIFNCEIEYMPK